MTRVHFERMVPSEEVGEYSCYKEKKTGYLYPLAEEGEYGPLPTYKYRVPGKWAAPDKYEKRERKPKVYASYAVSSECALHAQKLGKYERNVRPSAGRLNRASSAPPSFKLNPESNRKPVRQVSLPPIEFNEYQEECELISKLSVSRASSADIEEPLLDRSADSEANVEAEEEEDERILISLERSGEEGGELGLSTRLLREQRKTTETFMSSTGTFLREEPLTTYVI